MFSAIESAFVVLLFVVPLTICKKRYLKYIEQGISYVCMISSCLIIMKFFEHYHPYERGGGVSNNASMDASLIAFTYPFLVMRKSPNWNTPWPLVSILVPPLAIYLSNASMGIITLSVVLTAWVFFKSTTFLNKLLYSPLIFVTFFATGAFGMYLTVNALVDGSGRGNLFKRAYEFWGVNADPWLGMGLGTTQVFLPLIQQMNGIFKVHGVDLWMHNDWLQILFELGWVGLISAMTLYFFLLVWSIRHMYLFCALLGYGFCMFGNFPLHWPITAFVGAFIGVRILRDVKRRPY